MYFCNDCFKNLKYSNCTTCNMIKQHLNEEEYRNYIAENRSKYEYKLQKKKEVDTRRQYKEVRRNALLEAKKASVVDIAGIVYTKVTCSQCKNIKLRYKNQEDREHIYRDEFNNTWEGKKCPNCFKRYIEEQNNKRKVKYEEKECLTCKSIFKPKAIDHMYCSKKCRPTSYKIIIRNCISCPNIVTGKMRYCSKECRPKKKIEQKEYRNICLNCNKEWVSNRRSKRCSKSCGSAIWKKANPLKYKASNMKSRLSKGSKLRKAASKRKIKGAKPKWLKWISIIEFYEKCPKGYQVDHIIPINHPDVCGLHVPWNMQYLKVRENGLKSNNFDYTYENISWKKKL
jgi:hypothetical protein